MLERYIAEHISTRLPDFDMPAFCAQLREVLPLRPAPSHQAHQPTPASLRAPCSGRRSCPSPTWTWTRSEPLATLRRLRCDAAVGSGQAGCVEGACVRAGLAGSDGAGSAAGSGGRGDRTRRPLCAAQEMMVTLTLTLTLTLSRR